MIFTIVVASILFSDVIIVDLVSTGSDGDSLVLEVVVLLGTLTGDAGAATLLMDRGLLPALTNLIQGGYLMYYLFLFFFSLTDLNCQVSSYYISWKKRSI